MTPAGDPATPGGQLSAAAVNRMARAAAAAAPRLLSGTGRASSLVGPAFGGNGTHRDPFAWHPVRITAVDADGPYDATYSFIEVGHSEATHATADIETGERASAGGPLAYSLAGTLAVDDYALARRSKLFPNTYEVIGLAPAAAVGGLVEVRATADGSGCVPCVKTAITGAVACPPTFEDEEAAAVLYCLPPTLAFAGRIYHARRVGPIVGGDDDGKILYVGRAETLVDVSCAADGSIAVDYPDEEP